VRASVGRPWTRRSRPRAAGITRCRHRPDSPTGEAARSASAPRPVRPLRPRHPPAPWPRRPTRDRSRPPAVQGDSSGGARVGKRSQAQLEQTQAAIDGDKATGAPGGVDLVDHRAQRQLHRVKALSDHQTPQQGSPSVPVLGPRRRACECLFCSSFDTCRSELAQRRRSSSISPWSAPPSRREEGAQGVVGCDQLKVSY
jgi:hypothetical protein